MKVHLVSYEIYLDVVQNLQERDEEEIGRSSNTILTNDSIFYGQFGRVIEYGRSIQELLSEIPSPDPFVVKYVQVNLLICRI